MSEATAVAEPEAQTPSTSPTTPEAIEQPTIDPTEATDTGTGAAPSEGGTEPSTAGTEGGEAEFKLEDLDAFKELGVESPTGDATQAGTSLEDLFEQESTVHHDNYVRSMNAEQGIKTILINQYGFDAAGADQLWNQVLNPWGNSLHGNNEGFNSKRRALLIEHTLEAEDLKIWKERDYRVRDDRGRIDANRTVAEEIKGLVELGQRKEREKVAADHKAGKRYSLTPAQLKNIVEEYKTKYIAAGQRQSQGSGQVVNGTSAGGGQFRNVDALYTAWNDKQISRDTYRSEYKRLTGEYPD